MLKRREEARALRPVRHGEREPDPPGMGRRPRLQRRGYLRWRRGRRLRRQLGRHSGEHSPRRRRVRGQLGLRRLGWLRVAVSAQPRRAGSGYERDVERDVRRGVQRHGEAHHRAHSRQERVRHAHTVKVPAGAVDGGRVRLKGQGAPGENGGAAGDLLITTKIDAHPYYRSR